MLLWIPPKYPNHHHNHSFDDDEKTVKLQRLEASVRARNMVLLVLGIIGFSLVGMTALSNHHFFMKKNGGAGDSAAMKNGGAGDAALLRNTRNLDQNHRLLPMDSIYRLSVKDINDELTSLEEYSGMVTLVVNTACLWGKTKLTFTELQELQEKYEDQGFTVLAFPIEDFQQELGTNQEIRTFLKMEFPQVTFPVFGRSSLRSSQIFHSLRQQLPDAGRVKHNFYKYLVDRDGKARALFPKKTPPSELESDIEALLEE